MKDDSILREQFFKLEKQINEEDRLELEALQKDQKREEANIASRETENTKLLTDLGLKNTPDAFTKAMENAKKRTSNSIGRIQKEMGNTADPKLEDGKLQSQIQAMSTANRNSFQSALYHASVDQLAVGDTKGTKELELGSINAWCWAKGGGLFSSADIVVNANFWFLHYPSSYCYLHIHPYVVLHGFYINIADDEWWNSAYSRTRVDVKVRSHQYYWSNWSNTTVHNLGDDNINRARRIDRSSHHFHHMNVGPGDPVWTLVRIRLYSYARAAGSYSEVNFSDGAANYIDVPHVDFFC
jgi:hypothetical protein